MKRTRQSDGLLKNLTNLAEALGVSPVFIKRMKWAGFPMPGGRSTIVWALAWLKAHPDFKQSDWTRPRRGAEHPAASGAGK
jgi:hypothetical protein